MDTRVVVRYGLPTRVLGTSLFTIGAAGAIVTLPLLLAIPAAGAAIWLAIRWWRVAALAGASQLIVRNWTWTYRIPWAAVQGWQLSPTHLRVEVDGRRDPIPLDATNLQSLRSRRRSELLQAALQSLVGCVQKPAD